ncbi:PHO85 cyclin-1 [Marasmius crinis-equi]|uniref:PHO85 cyclin-1 n=1 Tax=Marasmius crinis-equi TaxID=585013 RepID=A0ABR3EU28_9AGAR
MIDYVALETINTVRVHGSRSSSDSSLRDFIYRLVKHVNVSVGTLLATTIYYDRIRPKLTDASATLIVSSKYLNDSSPKTCHWQKYAGIASLEDVNLMERQLIQLLDYNLRFDEAEACRYFAPFMAIRAQQASTRAIAVDKVTRAGKARAQAQAQAQAQIQAKTQQERPTEVSSLQPVPRDSSISSTLAAAVKEIVKRPSKSQLQNDSLVAPVMHRGLSAESSSSSSSDIGSLIDDTGSSSGSSSGWGTSDSESDSEEERFVEPQVYSNSSIDHYPDDHYASHLHGRGHFIVRPVPSYNNKNSKLQNRSRKPSDASSVCTVTATSPTTSSSLSSLSSHSRRPSSKRSASISVSNLGNTRGNPLSSSATMPSIPRTGLSGNFLSRMWGAAKAQAGMHDKTASDIDPESQLPSAFKRLVLVPSRSALSRSTTTTSPNV